jgi:hypothetical protein
MTIRPFSLVLLLGGGLVLAQEGDPQEPPKEEKPAAPVITFTDQEVENFIATFEQTYKNKDLPQEDAVATLANLKNAYEYLKGLGDQRSKEQAKLQKEIVTLIAKKGLFVRKRPLVNLACAQKLGEIGDPDGSAPLAKWIEGVLEDKSPNPQAVEAGFMSLAWIGPDDKTTLELVLNYASKGKHTDNTVAAHAIRACKEWRQLDGKMRKEFYDKISLYLQGLYNSWKGGDPKQKGTFEQRYKAVETDGLEALKELGDGTKFEDPNAAREWYNENKKKKWDDYVGPRFRAAPAAAPKEDKP